MVLPVGLLGAIAKSVCVFSLVVAVAFRRVALGAFSLEPLFRVLKGLFYPSILGLRDLPPLLCRGSMRFSEL